MCDKKKKNSAYLLIKHFMHVDFWNNKIFPLAQEKVLTHFMENATRNNKYSLQNLWSLDYFSMLLTFKLLFLIMS